MAICMRGRCRRASKTGGGSTHTRAARNMLDVSLMMKFMDMDGTTFSLEPSIKATGAAA